MEQRQNYSPQEVIQVSSYLSNILVAHNNVIRNAGLPKEKMFAGEALTAIDKYDANVPENIRVLTKDLFEEMTRGLQKIIDHHQ